MELLTDFNQAIFPRLREILKIVDFFHIKILRRLLLYIIFFKNCVKVIRNIDFGAIKQTPNIDLKCNFLTKSM